MTLKIRFYFIYIYIKKKKTTIMDKIYGLHTDCRYVNYCLREKISAVILCTKTKSVQELKFWYILFFIIISKARSYQLRRLIATYGITFQIDFLKFILKFTLLAMETYGITSHCFHSLTCVTGIYLKQGVGRGLVPSFEIGPMRCLLLSENWKSMGGM